ncbi:MAG: SulP family inorganic anion transporter, partial [Chitinophagaceae bacterium]
IPNSVIKGMLAGIGIILIIKQLPYLVGYDAGSEVSTTAPGSGSVFGSLSEAIQHITPIAMIIGVAGLALMILFDTKWMKSKKVFQILNGPLVVVLVGVLLVQAGGGLSTTHLVNLPVADSLPEFVGLLTFPNWQFLNNPDVWVTAITLALVASLETLLAIEAVDKIDPEKRATPNNRELMAQGSGNIVSGLLGGLPLTSVIVRSSANINAGAKSKMSTIIHGSLILVSVLFLPAILNMIPKAALAAVLIYTGYKLAKVSLFKEYYKKGWHQFMPFVVTLSSIVLTDLLTGVMIGLVLAVFYIIRDNFRSSIYMVQDRNNYMLRLRKDISFFSKPILKKGLISTILC